MMGITNTEAMDYITFMPVQDQLNGSSYWLRGFALIMTVIACCTIGTVDVAFAIVCTILFGIVLITSCKFIMNKYSVACYALLSDSFAFLSCSTSLTAITTYIIYEMSGNLSVSFTVPILINIVDIFLVAVYARTMIKKRLYKKESNRGIKAMYMGVGGAGLGWIIAKHLFTGTTDDQQLSILAMITLLVGLTCNFGLIGFVKYYCCTVVAKFDQQSK